MQNLVLLKTLTTEFEAELIRTKLEKEGIHAMLQSEDISNVLPSLDYSNGIHLFVTPEDEASARQIIDNIEDDLTDDMDTGEEEEEED